jgi:hypothetical protein
MSHSHEYHGLVAILLMKKLRTLITNKFPGMGAESGSAKNLLRQLAVQKQL